MKGALTIAARDFRQLLVSPMFLAIAGLCTTYWSFRYLRDSITFATTSMSGRMGMMGGQTGNIHWDVFVEHIFQTHIILLLTIPAITMKLLAEEKKLKTFDLLLTAPISSADIAIGKFLAGWGVTLVIVLISLIYPLSTGFFASFHYGPLIAGYVGLTLVASVYVSVGVFASSLTESNILSIVLAFIICLSFLLMGQASEMSSSPVVSDIIQHLSLGDHFMVYIRGMYQVTPTVFLLSCVVFFVFLSQRVVESARWR